MPEIIAKFSDYAINTIEYFIEEIQDELNFRDISGLFNDRIEIIKVTKQHPLVTLMASQLQEARSLDAIRSGILPAISVTPANPTEEGFTLGQTYKPESVGADFIARLKVLLNMTPKDRQDEVLLTNRQIELILSEYKKNPAGSIRAEVHEWRRNEEVNISAWSESPDLDILLGNVLDSILADIQVGFAGDESKVQNMKWKATKGLTNFNFGRTIFGSEYSLTFLNTYNNYTIYSDDVLSGHEFVGTYRISGEE